MVCSREVVRQKWIKSITLGPYVHQAFAFRRVGLGYEKKLTKYPSLTSRLSIEWQQFKQFSKQEYNIIYKHPAIYLQIGLSVHLN